MILAYWCVLLGAFMPTALVGVAKFIGKRRMGLGGNHSPRDWLAECDGHQKRANYAHLNSHEAFPPFAAGVIIAVIAGGSVAWINLFAVLWLIMRVIYAGCYITDRAELRSLFWFAASGCTVALFLVGLFG